MGAICLCLHTRDRQTAIRDWLGKGRPEQLKLLWISATREGPKVCGLAAGGSRIRTRGPAASRMTGTFGSATNIHPMNVGVEHLYGG